MPETHIQKERQGDCQNCQQQKITLSQEELQDRHEDNAGQDKSEYMHTNQQTCKERPYLNPEDTVIPPFRILLVRLFRFFILFLQVADYQCYGEHQYGPRHRIR